MTDQPSCPPSSSSDPQTVISDTVAAASASIKPKATIHLSPHSPTFRHNPFNGDSDTNATNTSADVTPVHVSHRRDSTVGDEMENGGDALEVIRYSSYSFPQVWLSGWYFCVILQLCNVNTFFRIQPEIVCFKNGSLKHHFCLFLFGCTGWPDGGNL